MMQLPHQPLCTSILHRLLSFLFLCCPSASKKQADEPLINLPLHIELFVYDACLEWLGFWSPVSYQLKKKIKVPALSNQLLFYDSYKHYCEKKNCKILVWRISSYHLNIRIYMLGWIHIFLYLFLCSEFEVLNVAK